MSEDKGYEYKDMGLEALVKAFKDLEDAPQARVGILGSKTSRNSDNTNASIGMKHEFGEIVEYFGKQVKLPVRSFLRVPIIENMQKYLQKANFFNKNSAKKVIEEKSFVTFIKMLGIVGETIVLDAFASGGFGKWKPSNMQHKKNKQTLVETQQLRNSITSDVK